MGLYLCPCPEKANRHRPGTCHTLSHSLAHTYSRAQAGTPNENMYFVRLVLRNSSSGTQSPRGVGAALVQLEYQEH